MSHNLWLTLKAGRAFHTESVPCAEYCPNANSAIKIGIPQTNNITKYGMKKTPPPFWYAKYGKRQTLPSPTQYPMQESRNSNFPPQVSRFSISSPWIHLYFTAISPSFHTYFIPFHSYFTLISPLFHRELYFEVYVLELFFKNLENLLTIQAVQNLWIQEWMKKPFSKIGTIHYRIRSSIQTIRISTGHHLLFLLWL